MTVLFIPDISGFTTFVKEVDIQHSKHIIKELMELLIETNKNNFTLAEIEGDALFYYQDEQKIGVEQIITQVQNMHRNFHEHLNLYRYRRVCNCGACTTAGDLELKFIVHIGETDFIELNNQKKPFGPDVITTHRLLKNKVEAKEYVIFSEAFFQKYQKEIEGKLGERSLEMEEEYDGNLTKYRYYHLEKPILEEEKLSFPQLDGIKAMRMEHFVNADPNELYQYIVDLGKRLEWTPGLTDLKMEKALNEIGTSHFCVVNGKNVKVDTVFSNPNPDQLIYVEASQDVPFMKNFTSVFKVKAKENGSLFIADLYFDPANIVGRILKPLLQKNFRKTFGKSLEKLDAKFS